MHKNTDKKLDAYWDKQNEAWLIRKKAAIYRAKAAWYREKVSQLEELATRKLRDAQELYPK